MRARSGWSALVGVVLALAGGPAAGAAEFVVDDEADAVDVKPGDRQCRTAIATCTLRAAVQEANATPGHDAVLVGPGTHRLTIPPRIQAGTILDDDPRDGDLDVTESLTLRGAGARATTIDGGRLDRVVATGYRVTTVISDLTITGGDATGRGTSSGIGMGGAVFNRGTMTLERLRLVGNHADGGGAVFSIPVTYITIRDSLLADNRAITGGAIRFDSGGELVNSTVTGNRLALSDVAEMAPDEMTGWGGGIDHRGGNDVAIVNSTISGNHAVKGGGGLASGQGYIPISDRLELGRVRLRNTIVAGNTSEHGPANCHVSAQIIESVGHNLASDESCFLTAPGDLPGRDAQLGALADNGGPTETLALLPGSPAIDAGSRCQRRDQRGVARPAGAACDVGAYEYVPKPPRAKRKRKRAAHRTPRKRSQTAQAGR